jgi:hypothetical protein
VLVVLDDVWSCDTIEPFLIPSGSSKASVHLSR